MKIGKKNAGERAFRSGLSELARHRPDKALKLLRLAVDECPATRAAELSERMYWLAMALLRLDKVELALKSLATAQKLRPRGFARRSYNKRANEYGMPRRHQSDLDDFYAFFAIQTQKYLAAKREPRFFGVMEKDAITHMISEAWCIIRLSGRLPKLGFSEKLELFMKWPVVFIGQSFLDPSIFTGISCKSMGGSPMIEPRVRNCHPGSSIEFNGRCPCGSGLPYRRCCGRISNSSELFCE